MLLIKNCRILDPANQLDIVGSIGIEKGKIISVGEVDESLNFDQVIDASGWVAAPGLIDVHVHLDRKSVV